MRAPRRGRRAVGVLVALVALSVAACTEESGSTPAGSSSGSTPSSSPTCAAPEPLPGVDLPADLRRTADCVEFVRTPDERFEGLPGDAYAPHYVTFEGLRVHHLDEGPRDGPPVVLLHGEPTWSYMYRAMVAPLVARGHRVIVPDLLGTGRSDKPVEPSAYSYLGHVATVVDLLEQLDLSEVTLVGHDWGAFIGLRVAHDARDRVARSVVLNGLLPVFEEGREEVEVPDPATPDPSRDLPFTLGPEGWEVCDPDCREGWVAHAMVDPDFRPSEVLEVLGEGTLAPEVLAAYDAPYPTEAHMTGVRVFPSLLNTIGEAPTNEATAAWWASEDVPLLTLFGRRDANLGSEVIQDQLTAWPGALGQPHHAYADAGHLLIEQVPEDLSGRIADWVEDTPAG